METEIRGCYPGGGLVGLVSLGILTRVRLPPLVTFDTLELTGEIMEEAGAALEKALASYAAVAPDEVLPEPTRDGLPLHASRPRRRA